MYWTKTVRGLCKIFVVLGILASIGAGAVLMDTSPMLGIVTMIVGSVVALISVSFIMMISEIPMLLNELKNEIKGSTAESNDNAAITYSQK